MSEDNPTVSSDGSKSWWIKDKLHREDGPACECADGSKYWYINDLLHREDGPAIEWADGTEYWFINGERHREDGPAIEYPNGEKSWYLNGTELTEDLFNKVTKGPVKELPLYLGLGFDDFISERLKS